MWITCSLTRWVHGPPTRSERSMRTQQRSALSYGRDTGRERGLGDGTRPAMYPSPTGRVRSPPRTTRVFHATEATVYPGCAAVHTLTHARVRWQTRATHHVPCTSDTDPALPCAGSTGGVSCNATPACAQTSQRREEGGGVVVMRESGLRRVRGRTARASRWSPSGARERRARHHTIAGRCGMGGRVCEGVCGGECERG